MTEQDTPRPDRVVDLNDPQLVDWVSNPVFDFTDETAALKMLNALGEEVRAARTQEHHAMRYLKAAAIAARQVTEDGKPVSKQAIINASGVARQTIYNVLPGPDDE